METGGPEEAAGGPVVDPRPALVLAIAGALVFAASLAPWPMIDILDPVSGGPDGLWLDVGLLLLPAGLGIIFIGSRIVVEAGDHRRPWTTAGLSLIFIVAGLAAFWVSFSLLGYISFQGFPPLLFLAIFAGLAIIGSRIPMSATARRPWSVALILAVVALGALLLVESPSLADDPQGWRTPFDIFGFGWLVGAAGAVIATVAAWRLQTDPRT
jgi:hypothetical protein